MLRDRPEPELRDEAPGADGPEERRQGERREEREVEDRRGDIGRRGRPVAARVDAVRGARLGPVARVRVAGVPRVEEVREVAEEGRDQDVAASGEEKGSQKER